VRLVSSRGGGISPAWSPDGTQIVFLGDKDRNFDVYVVNLDGTGLVRLTRELADDFDPDWFGPDRA
jgi:TolB protein